MPAVSRGTSSAYLSKLSLLCGPFRQVTFPVISFLIMAVHVNPYVEDLAKFLQRKEAQRQQRPQALLEQRLKPAAGVAAALAEVEGAFRVVISCFVFCRFYLRFRFLSCRSRVWFTFL